MNHINVCRKGLDMATIILLRHAHSVANASGILAGRKPGIDLSDIGRAESKRLIPRLSGVEINHIYVSPLERCSQTIEPLLKSKESSRIQTLTLDERIIEMDYGKWSGRKLSSLSREKLWSDIQSQPSKVTFPEGESFKSMRKRAMNLIGEILSKRGNGNFLIVTHGDVIKVITALLLGMKIDNFQSLTIDPASMTVFKGDSENARMVAFNDTESTLSSIIGVEVTKKMSLGGGSGKR